MPPKPELPRALGRCEKPKQLSVGLRGDLAFVFRSSFSNVVSHRGQGVWHKDSAWGTKRSKAGSPVLDSVCWWEGTARLSPGAVVGALCAAPFCPLAVRVLRGSQALNQRTFSSGRSCCWPCSDTHLPLALGAPGTDHSGFRAISRFRDLGKGLQGSPVSKGDLLSV